jgi:plastocyanin
LFGERWVGPTRHALCAGLVAIAGLGGALIAGCFSEHREPTAISGTCNIDLGEAFPGSTVVVIQSFVFGPTEVRVRAGERVTWLNCDIEAHTSTANNGEWASPLLATGQGFTQTFTTAGQFDYHCEPHPFMTGRVIVE